MIGQYLFSPFIGKIFDSYGPRACSFLASILFTTGFGLFSREISRTPNTLTVPSPTSFHRLVVLFFMGGLAAVLSCVCYLIFVKCFLKDVTDSSHRYSRQL